MNLEELPKCVKCTSPMYKQGGIKIEGAKSHRAHGHCGSCYNFEHKAGSFKHLPKPKYNDTQIQCNSCKIWKDYSKFDDTKNSKIGKYYKCSLCRRLWERYKLTLESFNAILKDQGYCCPICSFNFEGDELTYVDHDHNCCSGIQSCGKCVRGILCRSCNFGLGQFKDNIDYMYGAISYLERYYDKQ